MSSAVAPELRSTPRDAEEEKVAKVGDGVFAGVSTAGTGGGDGASTGRGAEAGVSTEMTTGVVVATLL